MQYPRVLSIAASDSDIKRLTSAYVTFSKAKSDHIAPAFMETLIKLMDDRKLWSDSPKPAPTP